MNNNVQQLCKQFSSIILDSRNTDTDFERIDGANKYDEGSLIFVSDPKSIDSGAGIKPAVMITNAEIAAGLADADYCVIVVKDVRLAQSLIKQHYSDYDSRDSEWDSVHPSAVIHPSVEIGENARIGPNTVLGRNVKIGNNTIVRANCVIEHDVQIGADSVIHSLVNIGYGCRIGQRVIIRPGVIIGNEGFGFAQDEDKHYHRVPHTGIVEIHDDVQIGSNCNVDRGTYGKTVLCRGVKIDSLCHVAHNVIVGEDALFVSQTGVAGSATIGKRVLLSGQTGVLDHRSIVDDAVLVHRCGVTEDIETPGVWAGTPPKPLKEYVRTINSYKKLDRLTARIKALEKLVNKPES